MLISLEGIDGSGKSTQARLLADRLEREGFPALLVREPGGAELSERIRALLLDEALEVHPFAELLLFSAARAQMVAEKVRPALARGVTVVCDRFYDSTTAYQGGGRELADLDWLRGFHARVTQGLAPERTYLITLSPEAAEARRRARSPRDRMERGGDAFFHRVAEAYARLAAEEPGRIRTLDGAGAIAELHEQIWADTRALLAAQPRR